MKKLALALVTAATFAGTASADLTTGFYLGAGIGGNSLTTSGTVDVFGADVSSNFGRNRFEGSLYTGYGYVTGCTYLGGELGYTFTGGKAGVTGTFNNTTMSAFIERRNIINAAFIVGQKFSPSTMIYARLGMNSTQYRAAFTAPGVQIHSKKRKVSFAPGAGIEGAVTKNVRIRLQYVYDLGNSLYQSGKVRSQATTLGVAYKF